MRRGRHPHSAHDEPSRLDRGVRALVTAQVRPLSRAVIDSIQRSIAELPEVTAGNDDFLIEWVPHVDRFPAPAEDHA